MSDNPREFELVSEFESDPLGSRYRKLITKGELKNNETLLVVEKSAYIDTLKELVGALDKHLELQEKHLDLQSKHINLLKARG